MPFSKLRDEANETKPEVMSHRNTCNQARATTTLAPTAGTNSKQKSNTVAAEPEVTLHCDAQTQLINHFAATIVPAAFAATASAGSKQKSNAVDANSDGGVDLINNAEGK